MKTPLTPADLSPDDYFLWEERVCIMHYDGHIPWEEAKIAALADILRVRKEREEGI